jgi:Na+/proline symporter
MPQMLPLAVALFYAFALFLFASWAEGDSHPVLKQRLRPPAYALALAVYCTSWTYYGAVGSAVADGWSYLPIYLGPVLVFVVAHPFLRRLIDAVKTDGANSISEFIGGRFGNSQGVAALVTILALLGSIPYLALQLRSLGTTYALIAGTQAGPLTIGFAAALLALFAMIYGTRRYEAGSRNDAILFAVSFESVLKLGALLVAGFIAVLLLAKAPEGAAQAGIAELSANFAPSRIGIDFFVITFLSMAAIVCLPRQFYVTVIEARSSADITAARWPFVIYMLLTLLVVLPISAAGMALLPGDSRPDLFVLQLPLSHGWTGAALLIFLGGFSAATAMALVETIALSTMVSNDLIAPFLVRSRRFEGEGNLGRVLLTTRRAAIAGIMGAALAWALGMGDSQRLALDRAGRLRRDGPVRARAGDGGDGWQPGRAGGQGESGRGPAGVDLHARVAPARLARDAALDGSLGVQSPCAVRHRWPEPDQPRHDLEPGRQHRGVRADDHAPGSAPRLPRVAENAGTERGRSVERGRVEGARRALCRAGGNGRDVCGGGGEAGPSIVPIAAAPSA